MPRSRISDNRFVAARPQFALRHLRQRRAGRPSALWRTATGSASAAPAARRWCFLLADIAAAGQDRATTTAIGDLRQIAALLEGLRALGSRPRPGRRAVAGARLGDRGERRGARLHHAGGDRPASSSSRWRAAAAARRCRAAASPPAARSPRKSSAPARPRIRRRPARRRARERAHGHASRSASATCCACRCGWCGIVDKAESGRRGAAHRRAVSRQPREGLAAVELDARRRSRRSPPRRPSRSRTPGSIARRWRRRGWSRRCGSPPRSSRRCCPKAGAPARSSRAAAASLPCRSIGGDFYDYVDLPNGALGFALGDVAGKGPPAALLSAMMQGIFAAQAATQRRAVADDHAA